MASDEARAKAVEALDAAGGEGDVSKAALTPDQVDALNHVRARRMMRTEDTMNIDSFGTDAIAGMVPRLLRGSLGLAPVMVDEAPAVAVGAVDEAPAIAVGAA